MSLKLNSRYFVNLGYEDRDKIKALLFVPKTVSYRLKDHRVNVSVSLQQEKKHITSELKVKDKKKAIDSYFGYISSKSSKWSTSGTITTKRLHDHIPPKKIDLPKVNRPIHIKKVMYRKAETPKDKNQDQIVMNKPEKKAKIQLLGSINPQPSIDVPYVSQHKHTLQDTDSATTIVPEEDIQEEISTEYDPIQTENLCTKFTGKRVVNPFETQIHSPASSTDFEELVNCDLKIFQSGSYIKYVSLSKEIKRTRK
jgi:hypothetical protein